MYIHPTYIPDLGTVVPPQIHRCHCSSTHWLYHKKVSKRYTRLGLVQHICIWCSSAVYEEVTAAQLSVSVYTESWEWNGRHDYLDTWLDSPPPGLPDSKVITSRISARNSDKVSHSAKYWNWQIGTCGLYPMAGTFKYSIWVIWILRDLIKINLLDTAL